MKAWVFPGVSKKCALTSVVGNGNKTMNSSHPMWNQMRRAPIVCRSAKTR